MSRIKEDNKTLDQKVLKTQNKPAPKKEAVITNVVEIKSYLKQYHMFSLSAFAGYLVLLALVFTSALEGSALLTLVAIISCLFYFTIYKSQTILLSFFLQLLDSLEEHL